MLDERESDDMRSACMNAALDAIVAERPEEALALIANIQAPMFLAGQLKSVYDAILAAGRTTEEVRAMPSPQPSMPDAAGMADYLFSIVNPWGMTELNTVPRREHKAELLEWIPKLRDANSAPFSVLKQVLADCPLNMGRVHPNTKPQLQVFRDLMQEFLAAAVDRHTAPLRALVFDVLADFDRRYRERKAEAFALDFNDLERCTINMLRSNEDVKKKVREQFRQIMLDEYQDINEQQADLIRLIRGEDRFFAVGDPNQSIYGFRHARPEIFRAYREEIALAGKHSAEILHNFRSRAPILLTVEAVLNSANGIDERELIATRQFHHKTEPSVEVLRVYGAERDEASEREARWIAHRIGEMRGTLELTCREGTRPAEFRDIAVLCRVGDAMQPILDALDDAGIPYVCGRRQSFLSQRQGLDIRAALHAIANPRDEIALATVLRSQLVGLSDEALLRLRLEGQSLVSGMNLVARESNRLAAFAADDAAKLDSFIDNLKRWRAAQGIAPLDVLI
jgi:ATP-dependent exoDNAse (exonuclease V) beta subunit